MRQRRLRSANVPFDSAQGTLVVLRTLNEIKSVLEFIASRSYVSGVAEWIDELEQRSSSSIPQFISNPVEEPNYRLCSLQSSEHKR
jgi:hypothetical protein